MIFLIHHTLGPKVLIFSPPRIKILPQRAMCAAPDVIQKNTTHLLKTAPRVWQRGSDGRQRVGPGGQLRLWSYKLCTAVLPPHAHPHFTHTSCHQKAQNRGVQVRSRAQRVTLPRSPRVSSLHVHSSPEALACGSPRVLLTAAAFASNVPARWLVTAPRRGWGTRLVV